MTHLAYPGARQTRAGSCRLILMRMSHRSDSDITEVMRGRRIDVGRPDRTCSPWHTGARCPPGPPPAQLLPVLMPFDFDRVDRIGEFWSYPEPRTFAELLIQTIWDRRRRRGAPPKCPPRPWGRGSYCLNRFKVQALPS